uniref:Uncharacterized protein n=1 Tax=viral metagenome TaxID=1070528 RepID=A0A6M3IK17_9ZZZZ
MKKLIFLIAFLFCLTPLASADNVVMLGMMGEGSADETPPTLDSFSIGYDGLTWTFNYSEPVTAADDGDMCDGYTVTMSTAGELTFTYAGGTRGTDSSFTCTGSAEVVNGETITAGLDYTQGTITDVATNALAAIDDKTTGFTNNVYPADCGDCDVLSGWEAGEITDGGVWTQNSTGSLTTPGTGAFQGTYRLEYSGATATNYMYKSVTGQANIAFRFALKSTSGTGSMMVASGYSAGAGSSAWYILRTSTGWAFYANASLVDTFTTGSTADTWYQVEVVYQSGTSTKWRIWDAAGTSIVQAEAVGGAVTRTDLTFRLGNMSSPGTTEILSWDSAAVRYGTTYIGPYVP